MQDSDIHIHIQYLLWAWFMIWNPSWSHQIVFWIQAVVSLRYVRIDLEKPEGKNDTVYAFAWGDEWTWPGQVLVFTELHWTKLYKYAFYEPTQMHRYTLWTPCTPLYWEKQYPPIHSVDLLFGYRLTSARIMVSAQRVKDYTIETCERKQLLLHYFILSTVMLVNFFVQTNIYFNKPKWIKSNWM